MSQTFYVKQNKNSCYGNSVSHISLVGMGLSPSSITGEDGVNALDEVISSIGGKHAVKVAIVGAAGVRTPQLVEALWARAEELVVTELALLDIDDRRLDLMENVIRELPGIESGCTKLTWTTDPRDALRGSDFVIFTIRVGNINSRVIDEQIPLKYGVIGQETTGPGGFSMAMRTIPVMLEYVELIKEVAPRAWILNLTNPVGMITQAITETGFTRIVGICDSPTALFRDIADAVRIPREELWFEYFGINHLGWIRRILHQRQDITQDVLNNDMVLLRHGSVMLDPDFIRALGMIPNEYLMFYYEPRGIVEQLRKNRITRGGIIEGLNRKLFAELEKVAESREEWASLKVYQQYARAREDSYMKVETADLEHGTLINTLWERSTGSPGRVEREPEGYAGIALSVMESLTGRKPKVIVVNAINEGAVDCLESQDIVELPCYVDSNGVHPIAVARVPEASRGLLQAVKSYERLTIQASRTRAYATALQALVAHPLVRDVKTARAILDEYTGSYDWQLQ